jgi:CRISPR-associated protein Cas1
LTQRGNPIAYLRSLEDDSHVKTRVCQYEALKDHRAFEIAKQFVKAKIEGQNLILKKYGLKTDTSIKLRIDALDNSDLPSFRRKLMQIEAKFSEFYFKQILQLFPETVAVDRRRTYKAYDGINNIFNLSYSLLKWKVHLAIVKSKLEPYLGFLHSSQFGKPSLVCDVIELYRCVLDDFIIRNSKNLHKKDFKMRQEAFSSKVKGQRQFLNKARTNEWMRNLNSLFQTTVEVPRVAVGNRQEFESLINEEAQLLARYLRGEKKEWVPRVPRI